MESVIDDDIDDYDISSSNSCNLFQLFLYDVTNTNTNTNIADADSYSPIWWCCMTCLLCSGFVFLVSELSGNYSQTDKLWSITPFVYTWILICDSRTFLMFVLTAIWGIRLTYNFSRRGGYKFPHFWEGDEDYRWQYLMGKVSLPCHPLRSSSNDQQHQRFNDLVALLNKHKIGWSLFNFFFISLYQNVLLLLVVTPAMVAHLVATKCSNHQHQQHDQYYSPSSLNQWDWIGCLVFLSFVVVESIADNQQQQFQIEKYRRIHSGDPSLLVGDYLDGFTRAGIYSWVRKPNYACEQGLWISFAIFVLAASFDARAGAQQQQQDIFVNIVFPHVGWICYVSLFQTSGPLTEYISLAKYPIAYAEYMTQTPLYVPNLIQYLLYTPTRSSSSSSSSTKHTTPLSNNINNNKKKE